MRNRWVVVVTIGALAVCAFTGMPASAEEVTATDNRLNVVLISLDTVRPDHLSCYGYHRKTTAHIDEIAREGTLFLQAFSQAPQTFPSHLALFTSKFPRKKWLWWESAELLPSTKTLTELLKEYGYTTAAFVGFNKKNKNIQPLLESRAFEAFDELIELITDVGLKRLPLKLFDWLLKHREEPFFLFVHGNDAHEPHVLSIPYDAKRFNPTYTGRMPSMRHELDTLVTTALAIDDIEQLPDLEQKRREVYLDHLLAPDDGVHRDDLAHLLAVYDAQIYYLDQGLGQLFQALENLHLKDRTLLVIVSDHGQAFGEHGQYISHYDCYDEVTRVVLIVRDPRRAPRGRTVTQLVQAIDVLPTILELLGLPIPASAQGHSLVPLLTSGRDPTREEIAISVGQGMRALRTPTWKLIQRTDGTTELYRIAKDPTEQRNVISRHPAIAARLQHRLDAFVQAEVAGPVVDPQQWMQEHGYW